MPKASNNSGPSAEKPKSSVPMTLLAYLYHMPVTPASMAILFLQSGGRTSSFYWVSCRSKSSMHGIETTRVWGSILPASTAY